mmetsp:Transcript_63118/g.56874  ORF Transcript_63118/g.56874 Transcript_63118/m.56874 type:complete len:436 (+) Transcript_63118:35-1342(+)
MLVPNDSDLDSMDPELLSQLPLQSDYEQYAMDDPILNNGRLHAMNKHVLNEVDMSSMISESNLDIDATENDEMLIQKPINNAEPNQIAPNKKKLDLINDRDDTEDTDLDDIQKPINNDIIFEKPWYHKPKNWLKLNLVFFLLALLISGLSQPKMLWNLLQIFLKWMENHIVGGSFVFISLYIACDLLMLPCLIFTLGAGFVYCNVLHSMWKGLFVSTFVVFISELIGSTIAFLSARYLLRKTIKKIASKYPKFSLIDAAVKRHGFRVTLLFRLSPVTPYNLLNYFMGLTSIRFMDYTLASFGILPNFIICCLMGGSLHHIYQLSQIDISNNIPLLIVTIIGILFIIVLIIYGTRFIKRELAKISLQMKQEKDILSSSDYLNDDDENHPLTDNHDHGFIPNNGNELSNLDDIVSIDLVSNDNDISNISADPSSVYQ